MIVVDLNLLVYGINTAAPQHVRAREWWEQALSADETVGIPWAVTLGFLRVTTSRRILPRPLSAETAVSVLDDWFAQPPVRRLEPTERHWEVLRDLLRPVGTAGNLTTDAHLAALAIEHGATLCSNDNDFTRFPNLRWRNPLA